MHAGVVTMLLLINGIATAHARDFIRVVGSSTVFPFVTLAAEEFSLKYPFSTPIVEQVGTGGGFKLFCGGLGSSGRFDYPDIANASRQIKPSERALCERNGVDDVLEIPIGFDGIAMANVQTGPTYDLTIRHIYLALARRILARDTGTTRLVDNPYENWSQIDPKLPDRPILVYGPPASSGTREAFVKTVMLQGCLENARREAKSEDTSISQLNRCLQLRSDGHYVEAGENDNVIVQRLKQSPEALGVLPFAIVFENARLLKPAAINDTTPNSNSIASQRYVLARQLYLYVKSAHLRTVPGLGRFLTEIISENAVGPYGYLTEIGLVALPSEDRKKSRGLVLQLQKKRPFKSNLPFKPNLNEDAF